MTTIAIFGGTGYAGSAIKDEALKRGHRFTVACQARPSGSGCRSRIATGPVAR